jgi:hypothetical protein
MVELESQEAATTMKVASAKHVTATVALRVGAAATSLAAAVLVVTNRQQRWGIEVNFTMFDVWVYVTAINLSPCNACFLPLSIRQLDRSISPALSRLVYGGGRCV